MLSSCTSALDKILSKEEVKNDKKGLGYSKGESLKTKATVFICASEKININSLKNTKNNSKEISTNSKN